MPTQDAAVDVAFLGAPRDSVSAERWAEEIALVQAAGRRVSIHLREDAGATNLSDALLVLIADAALVPRQGDLNGHSRILVRRAGAESPLIARELEQRLRRRVAIAPLGAEERRVLSSEVPGRLLTETDWPPLVRASAIAKAAVRAKGPPWLIGFASDLANPDPPDVLKSKILEASRSVATEALGKGLSPIDFECLRVDTFPDPNGRNPHVIVCQEIPEPDRLAVLLEGGSLVVVLSEAAGTEAGFVRHVPAELLAKELATRLLSVPSWRAQFLTVLDHALVQAGDAAFLRHLADVASPRTARQASQRSGHSRKTIDAGLALIGDFRRVDESNEQALAQILIHATAGDRCLLVHAAHDNLPGHIHPAIDAAVREGRARVLPPDYIASVASAQVVFPSRTIPALSRMRPAIDAARWLAVDVESTSLDWDAAALDAELARLYSTSPAWAASHPDMRKALASVIPASVEPWEPKVTSRVLSTGIVSGSASGLRTIGLVAYDPNDAATALEFLRDCSTVELHAAVASSAGSTLVAPPKFCSILDLKQVDQQTFVGRLDLLVVPPGVPYARLPRLAVANALAKGQMVIASPNDRHVLGAGPVYIVPDEWPAWIDANLSRLQSGLGTVSSHLRGRSGTDESICGRTRCAPTPKYGASTKSVSARPPRALFVTANGVGMGHLTRLAAIARRLPNRIEPIFATMSQAAGVLKDMGFPCEMLTSYAGKPPGPWTAALRSRMNDILDQYRPSVLVLDASNPYPGLIEAAACRPGLKLVWVRRGMWRTSQDNRDFLSRAPYFDLIIEPHDIAENDAIELSTCRGRQIRVPPIGLLDEHEILDRATARRTLGLSDPPQTGSVLIQLGSGTTRDLDFLLGQVLDRLEQFRGLEIVLAQWLITPSAYANRWPGVRILTGYPIPRYYRAFDFTISAAGYNSFNDLLRFGIPTIFIANDAECMDDQGARARFAEEAEAAFDVGESDLDPLAGCVSAMLQPEVRSLLSRNAKSVSQPNGAGAAALAVAEVLG